MNKSFVTIKELKGVVTCGEDGAGEHVFNVKNITDGPLHVGAEVVVEKPLQNEWFEDIAEFDLEEDTVTQVSAKFKVPTDGCEPGKYSYRLRVFDPDEPGVKFTAGEPVHFEVPAPATAPPVSTKKFNWWIPAGIGAALLLVIGIVLAIVLSSGEDGAEPVQLPDFTQMSLDDAKMFLDDNGIAYTTIEQADPGEPGIVLDQLPLPDEEVEPGTDTVELVYSSAGGAAPMGGEVTLPDFTDMSLADAEQFLKNNNINYTKIVKVDPKATSAILAQYPRAADNVEPGKDTVELTVSALPDFSEWRLAAIERFLKNNNIKFTSQIKEVREATTVVISQSPAPETVIQPGMSVELVLNGLPNVTSWLMSEARQYFKDRKIKVKEVPVVDADATQSIIGQQPLSSTAFDPRHDVVELKYDALPDFTKMTLEGAKQFLGKKKKSQKIDYELVHKLARKTNNLILGQKPRPGAVVYSGQTKVALTIASVKMPNLSGKDLVTALQSVDSSGLTFDLEKNLKSVKVTNASKNGKIARQSPAKGATVYQGTNVTLTVGKLQEGGYVLDQKQYQRVQKFQNVKPLSTKGVSRMVAPASKDK